MVYDPIEDDRKVFTLREWEAELKAAVTDYANEFDDANEFQRQSHTWHEWMASFARFMSW